MVEKRKYSVLIVDDHPANRDLLRIMLQAADCDTAEACDGQEAVNAASAEAFDLILMDVQMPVMDGLEATRQIRSNLQLSSLVIIAMTANVTVEDHRNCEEAGMNDFIGKPLDPRLAPGGIICQWVNAYNINQADLRSVIATFRSVFPEGTVWLVGGDDVLLLATLEPLADALSRTIRDLNGFLREVDNANLVARLLGQRLNFPLQVFLHHRRLHGCFAVGEALVKILPQAEAVRTLMIAGGGTGAGRAIEAVSACRDASMQT